MCQIVSVVVHPITMEVFHSPGSWHHHEICHKLGLNQDKMFCPEIQLSTLTVDFSCPPIALKQTVPPELLQELLLKYNVAGANGQQVLCELRISHEWTKEHIEAVQKWSTKHIGSSTKLLKFSEHTFNRPEFSTTINTQTPLGEKFHKLFDKASPSTARDTMLLHQYWKRTFEQPEARVPVWSRR